MNNTIKAQLKQAAEIAKQFRGSAGDLTPAEPRDGTRRLKDEAVFAQGAHKDVGTPSE